jgi:hypothetical protein
MRPCRIGSSLGKDPKLGEQPDTGPKRPCQGALPSEDQDAFRKIAKQSPWLSQMILICKNVNQSILDNSSLIRVKSVNFV